MKFFVHWLWDSWWILQCHVFYVPGWLKSPECARHHFSPHLHVTQTYTRALVCSTFLHFSCCSLPVAYWDILKWATLYWNAILCGLAAISTSQWSATNLVELIFQRLHLISSLMPDKSNKTLTLPKSFSYPSKTGVCTTVTALTFLTVLCPLWLLFSLN